MQKHNVKILIQHITLFGISNKLASKIMEELRKCGLTKENMQLLEKYPIKFGWLIALIFYERNNYELPVLLKVRLSTSIPQLKDIDLELKMTNFLNSPSVDKARNLYDDIKNSLPVDLIKDFFDLCQRLDKNAQKLSIDLKNFLKNV